MTLEGGFQRIFQNLVGQMQNKPFPPNVFLSTKINKINSDDKSIIIESESISWRAKAAYVTSGWQHIEMPGIDNQIKHLFKNLIFEDYGTTIFEAKKPVPLMLEYQENSFDPTMCISKFPLEYSGTKVIAYTSGTINQISEVFNNLKTYLKRKGITLAKSQPLAQRQVEYHPRFTPQTIQEGAYKILEDKQGTGGIFFGGAPLTFDLSEAVAAHSKRMAPIVNKFLKERS